MKLRQLKHKLNPLSALHLKHTFVHNFLDLWNASFNKNMDMYALMRIRYAKPERRELDNILKKKEKKEKLLQFKEVKSL